MKRITAAIMLTTMLSFAGCAIVGEILVAMAWKEEDAKGTSREPGISQEEKEYRRIEELQAKRREEAAAAYYERWKENQRRNTEWNKSIDRAFSEYSEY